MPEVCTQDVWVLKIYKLLMYRHVHCFISVRCLWTRSVGIVMLQRIPTEEEHGSNFTYEVVERPVGSDRWTVVLMVPSEKLSASRTLQNEPVELAVVSKNEIGNTLPSSVFTISSSVLCQFSNLSLC